MFFFSSRRRHTRLTCDWSSDVCSSDLHFVRPGSQRIAARTDAPGLLVAAFRNGATNSLIVVGAKQGGPHRLQIALPRAPAAPSAWELYATTPALDCSKLDTVPVRDGVAEFDLPNEAVFTL